MNVNLSGEQPDFQLPVKRQAVLTAEAAAHLGVIAPLDNADLDNGEKRGWWVRRSKKAKIAGGIVAGVLLLNMCRSNEQQDTLPIEQTDSQITPQASGVVLIAPPENAPYSTSPSTTEVARPSTTLPPTTETTPTTTTQVTVTVPITLPPAAVGQTFTCQYAKRLSEVSAGRLVGPNDSFVTLELEFSGLPKVQDERFRELTSVVVHQFNGGKSGLNRGSDPTILTGCSPK